MNETRHGKMLLKGKNLFGLSRSMFNRAVHSGVVAKVSTS